MATRPYRGYFVQLRGAKEARGVLAGWASAARRFGTLTVTLGSPLAYAYGIEFGVHRKGKLARKAGPAHYIKKGIESARSGGFESRVLRTILSPSPNPEAAMDILGNEAVIVAQATVPVRSGNLRRSIRFKRGGRLRMG